MEETKKSKKGLIILIVSIIAVVCIAVISIVIVCVNKGKKDNKKGNKPNDVVEQNAELIFTLNLAKTEYTVTSLKNKETATTSTIPNTYKNLPVTGIGESAFSSCELLTSVTIGNSVTSIESSAFIHCDNLKRVTIPNSVISIGSSAFYSCDNLSSVTIGNSVTSIGSYAFDGCNSLTSVTIGNSVASIGGSAFKYCFKLIEVYNKSSLNITKGGSDYGYVGYYALNVYTPSSGESKLSTDSNGYIIYTDGAEKLLVGYSGTATELTLPTEITQIYKYAFYNNDKMTNIIIPDSVESIGDSAFTGCYKLVEVYNKSSLNITKGSSNYGDIGYYALNVYTPSSGASKVSTDGNGYVIYADGAEKILVGYNGTVTNLTLLTEITQIYDKAFYKNDKITSVKIGDNVTSVGECAFSYCDSLTSVTIGESVTSIGNAAFSYCYKLVEIYNKSDLNITKGSIDNGHIGYYALNVYTDTTIPSKVSTDNNGYIIYTDGTEKILIGYNGTATELALPTEITQINNYAFYKNDEITSVIIEDKVINIGDYAFEYCNSLTNVTIGSSVTSIGEDAFYFCTSLTSVTIGENVTSIGKWAFYGCNSLTSVTFINPNGWYKTFDFTATSGTNISSTYLANTSTVASYLKSTYTSYYWKRNV